LEGFKHISWKKDQESDDACNFTFSSAELLKQNLCLEGINKAETTNKPSADMTVTGSVAACAGQDASCSSTVLTAASLENELSESESEFGDNEQCGGSSGVLGGTTSRVPLAANERAAIAQCKSGIFKSNSCLKLETVKEDGYQLPICHANLPENTEISEVQKVNDKSMEYCGVMKEINLPVNCMQDTVTQHSLTPLKVHCDTAVQNGCSTHCSVLNSTFALPKPSPSYIQEKTPRKLTARSSVKPKSQIKGNK
jgi:hypothetical protein